MRLKTVRRSLHGLAGAVFAGLVGAGVGATSVRAENAAPAYLTFPSESPLADFVLGWSPPLFDMAVYAGRSLAEITYGQRGYDAVTKSFVVSDLHVRRDAVDVSIGRLRVNSRMVMLDNVAMDTRGLDLPPELRRSLDRLGLQTINGNIEMRMRMNDARSAYDFALHVDVPGAGVLNAAATVDDFHVLVPLKDIEHTQLGGQPTLLGSLVHASFGYQDKGLSAAAYAIAGEQQGVTEQVLQAELSSMPSILAGQILTSLPGGASAELQQRALVWAHNVETFLKERGAISVSFDPPTPVPLSRFQAGVFDEALVAAMNPTVSNRLDAPAPIVSAPEGSVAAAMAEISGLGRPQNVEAGVTALLGGATGGDLDAIDALGAAFGSGMAPDGAATDRGLLYAALLVARARGGAVSDAVLAQAATGLAPDAVRGAEADAAAFFAKTDAGSHRAALTEQTVASYDAGALRGMAFDFYEGRGVPRDLTEAYALALLAAAAGDPIAAALRDDLVAASKRGDVVISAPDARKRADALWTAYAAHVTAPKSATGSSLPAAPAGAILQPPSDTPAAPSPSIAPPSISKVPGAPTNAK